MLNISPWKRLIDLLAEVMKTGLAKEEAQLAICQMIADRSVKIRCKLRWHTTRRMRSKTVLEGDDFDIPTVIAPEALDWEKSRPVKPWLVKHRAYKLPGYWELDWIEVCGPDVIGTLDGAGQLGASTQPKPRERPAAPRTRSARERAELIIKERWPEGVPDQATLPNARLCRAVGDELKKRELSGVSDDTILRASGGRK